MRNKGIPSKLLSGILTIAVAVALVAAVAVLTRYLHSHNTLLTAGETTALEPTLTGTLPEGEWVSLEDYIPLGSYASRASGVTLYGLSFGTGEDHYYLVLLRDFTFLSVKISNQADIDALEQLTTDVLHRYDTFADYFADSSRPTHPLSGQLVKLRDSELKGCYRAEVRDLLEEWDVEDYVRDYVVDSTTVRGGNVLILAGFCGAVLLLLVIALHSGRRRKKAAVQ